MLLTATIPNSTTQSFGAVRDPDATPGPCSSVEDSQDSGSLQAEDLEHLDKSMMVGQGVTVKKVKPRHRAKRLSEPPNDFYIREHQLQKSKVQQLKDHVTTVRNKLLKFQRDTIAPKHLFELLTAANKLYRLGEKCPVCPMCLKDKSTNGGQRKSHVIPEAILDYYKQIHGTSEHGHGYMYDFSRNERLSAQGLYYQLLCGECEIEYSKTEKSLAMVYPKLAADPHNNLTINHEGTDTPAMWLIYVLTNILLRGVLANIDLDNHFQEQEIMDEVYFLWTFCRAKLDVIYASKMSVPNLKVFFLPNKALSQSLIDFLFPLEMLLRMPRCTELIQYEKEGSFLYTKFDCFHVVLPLCEQSRAYFEAFDNGLEVDNYSLHFRWALQPTTKIDPQSKSFTFNYPKCTSTKDPRFPEALLRWCTSLYEDITSKLHDRPSFRWQPLAYVERYSGSKTMDQTKRPEEATKACKVNFINLNIKLLPIRTCVRRGLRPMYQMPQDTLL